MLLKVDLPKGDTRNQTRWSDPTATFSSEQLEYAAKDAIAVKELWEYYIKLVKLEEPRAAATLLVWRF